MKSWRNAERQVAKLLSKWFGIKLMRNLQPRKELAYLGDLVPKDEEQWADWRFVIEVKTRKHDPIDSIFHLSEFVIAIWTEQLLPYAKERAAHLGGEPIPMLVFKRDRRPWLVAVQLEGKHPGVYIPEIDAWVVRLDYLMDTFSPENLAGQKVGRKTVKNDP